jgi:hypothetical protein
MILKRIRIANNVAQVYVHEPADVFTINMVYQRLVSCGRVAIALLQYMADHISVKRAGSRS